MPDEDPRRPRAASPLPKRKCGGGSGSGGSGDSRSSGKASPARPPGRLAGAFPGRARGEAARRRAARRRPSPADCRPHPIPGGEGRGCGSGREAAPGRAGAAGGGCGRWVSGGQPAPRHLPRSSSAAAIPAPRRAQTGRRNLGRMASRRPTGRSEGGGGGGRRRWRPFSARSRPRSPGLPRSLCARACVAGASPALSPRNSGALDPRFRPEVFLGCHRPGSRGLARPGREGGASPAPQPGGKGSWRPPLSGRLRFACRPSPARFLWLSAGHGLPGTRRPGRELERSRTGERGRGGERRSRRGVVKERAAVRLPTKGIPPRVPFPTLGSASFTKTNLVGRTCSRGCVLNRLICRPVPW